MSTVEKAVPGSVAYSVERPSWQAQAEQYSDTVLGLVGRQPEKDSLPATKITSSNTHQHEPSYLRSFVGGERAPVCVCERFGGC